MNVYLNVVPVIVGFADLKMYVKAAQPAAREVVLSGRDVIRS